jgi:4'-phosphopantetheinyl transferase
MTGPMPASPLRPRERLAGDECHVWVVRVDEALAAGGPDRYLAWLTDEELGTLRRYRFDKHQREHLATRALARSALSRYTGVLPEAWRFGAGSHGKPHVVSPPAPLAFNLTNTEGLVACAVTAGGGDVGVDVEPSDAPGDPMELATAAFSPEEIAALGACPPADRRARFVALWTLKEAYVKARGLGLALPTTRFTVTPCGPTAATITFDPALLDAPSRWQLERITTIPRYHLAVALTRGPAGDRRIRVRTSPTLDVHAI